MECAPVVKQVGTVLPSPIQIFFLQTVKSSNHFSYETADFAVEISIKLLSHLQDLDIKKITNVRFTVEG